jgi:hypothetical protein
LVLEANQQGTLWHAIERAWNPSHTGSDGIGNKEPQTAAVIRGVRKSARLFNLLLDHVLHRIKPDTLGFNCFE